MPARRTAIRRGDKGQCVLDPCGSGTVVTSDGLGYFAAVIDAGCVHVPTPIGSRKPRDLSEFGGSTRFWPISKRRLPGPPRIQPP